MPSYYLNPNSQQQKLIDILKMDDKEYEIAIQELSENDILELTKQEGFYALWQKNQPYKINAFEKKLLSFDVSVIKEYIAQNEINRDTSYDFEYDETGYFEFNQLLKGIINYHFSQELDKKIPTSNKLNNKSIKI